MNKVHSDTNYDFYIGITIKGISFYNIVPKGSNAPSSGYPSMRFIEKVKGVRFPYRYQPELHGTRHSWSEKDSTRIME